MAVLRNLYNQLWPGLRPLNLAPSGVPHPFAFFLAKGWETTNLKGTYLCGQRPGP